MGEYELSVKINTGGTHIHTHTDTHTGTHPHT